MLIGYWAAPNIKLMSNYLPRFTWSVAQQKPGNVNRPKRRNFTSINFSPYFHTWSLLPIKRQYGYTAPLNTAPPERTKAVMLSTDNGQTQLYYLQNTQRHGPVGPRCDNRACRPSTVNGVCRSCPHFLQTIPQKVTTALFHRLSSSLINNHHHIRHYSDSG
jgi:hypothetical protein